MLRTIALACLLGLSMCAAGEATEREWRFRVYLDDKKIGHHDFKLREQGGVRLLETEANFKYRVLFMTLYHYEHRNVETWRGDCLTRIESQTDANGSPYAIEGSLDADRFLLRRGEQSTELPACIMSFAYWNPTFLQRQSLLNAQNGELVDVEVGEPERVEVQIRGNLQTALRYRLETEGRGMALYYSESLEWLALEAEAEGGRTLRYELI